jgi:serine/threonine protein kinase
LLELNTGKQLCAVISGLSRIQNAGGIDYSTTNNYHNIAANYAAPEVLWSVQGREIIPAHYANDIYSLGCIMYFMMTGEEPWSGMQKMR